MQKTIKPQYISRLNDLLPVGMQKRMAEELGMSAIYVHQILKGNRGRDLKSKRALEVVRYAENYILSNGLEYLPHLEYLGVAIKIHAQRGSQKAYSEAMSEVFTRFYSPVNSFNSTLFLN